MIKLRVNDREIETVEGKNLLEACLDNGIYIPNLCHINGVEKPRASCRLCFVDIEGQEKPVPSCTVKVKDGMAVKTNTPAVRHLQGTALQLLLSTHHVDCARCPANKKCELQNLAKVLKTGMKPGKLSRRLKDIEIDETHPFLVHYPNRCVLCGKCIYQCSKIQNKPFLTFAKRGIDTVVSFFGVNNTQDLPCEDCTSCVEACPVGAIIPKSGT